MTQQQGYTPKDFADAVLRAIGAPVTAVNEKALVAWEAQAGGHWNNSRQYNPLNTTQKEPGASYGGAQGNIGSYNSWQQGLDATVTTLTNGRYGSIVDALKRQDAQGFQKAVNSSPWGTHGVDVTKDYSGYGSKKSGGGGGILGDITGGIGDAAGVIGDGLSHIPGVGAVEGAGKAVANTGEAVAKITGTLFSASFWVRVAFIVIGFTLLMVGVRALVEGGGSGGGAPMTPPSPSEQGKEVVNKGGESSGRSQGLKGDVTEGAEAA